MTSKSPVTAGRRRVEAIRAAWPPGGPGYALLALVGLAVGNRRSRVGVFLFGIGGLMLLVPPALTADYIGRYMVPMAGPMMAATAITLVELWRGPIGRRWSPVGTGGANSCGDRRLALLARRSEPADGYRFGRVQAARRITEARS